jgi:integrase/recombinase XerD
VLTLYRRHEQARIVGGKTVAACPHASDSYWKKCSCPMWVRGVHNGRPIKESLKTRSWSEADKTIKEWEGKKKPDRITVESAVKKYYEDCEARRLSPNTLKKYRTVRDIVSKFAEEHGLRYLSEFGTQQVRDLLKGRNVSSITAAKELERVRTCFRFFEEQEWIPKNPAKIIKPPKVRPNPRLPFDEAEVAKIIGKCKTPIETTFIKTLGHSGLRIGDASLLKTSHLIENRLYLQTTKAGTPVHILLPPDLVAELKAITPKGGYLFLIGESDNPHTASNLWRRRIKRMCKDAKISPDHPHRFRHTLAADLLMRGASVEDVAAILGNSPTIVIKHYSQWIRGRQERLDDFLKETWTAPKLVRVK